MSLPEVVGELGRPVRSFPSYRGQRNFPGWYWSATMGCRIGFESWVERDHLVALDFDVSVVTIVSQPFWLLWPHGGKQRRHAPDFLVSSADGGMLVLDSRPLELIGDTDREAFEVTGRACGALGWRYAVWDRLDGAVTSIAEWSPSARVTRSATLTNAATLSISCVHTDSSAARRVATWTRVASSSITAAISSSSMLMSCRERVSTATCVSSSARSSCVRWTRKCSDLHAGEEFTRSYDVPAMNSSVSYRSANTSSF
nr:TnsA-like heteromeric transposase endonuclease subunit [Rhodococcus sp. 1168]